VCKNVKDANEDLHNEKLKEDRILFQKFKYMVPIKGDMFKPTNNVKSLLNKQKNSNDQIMKSQEQKTFQSLKVNNISLNINTKFDYTSEKVVHSDLISASKISECPVPKSVSCFTDL